MKNQNPNNKLTFNKVAVTELNDQQMHNVDGGTTSLCIVVFTTILIAAQ
ncbi:class I lanthipeptide [Flavobacterium sp.]